MEAVSQEPGTSSRTLSRRLLSLGTSYQRVLDRVRRQLADDLLDDPDNSLSDVATRLGFSGASSFHRVYKRWTGGPPGRRRGRNGSDA